MRAMLKSLISPDLNLETESPRDVNNFNILVECTIGPVDRDSGELFSFVVCTPVYLQKDLENQIYRWAKGILLVEEYEYKKVRQAIEELCNRTQGDTWQEIANKLSRFTNWEFEGYQESK